MRTKLTKKLHEIGKAFLAKFSSDSDAFIQSNYVEPVISAVGFLSKDMLAEVAESLVSLTSFKRRVTINSAETVGGPVDVAVISKGDGFIWIKRKHYFKPELNEHFFRNYFGD